MAEERAQRRLAAILAADVVGYSRLRGEEGAGDTANIVRRAPEALGEQARRSALVVRTASRSAFG